MSRIDVPRITLAKGSRGADVARLHGYLRAFGYLPNAERASRLARWRPFIAREPADPCIFDDALEAALRLYQRNHGLVADGRLDGATLALLKTPRCSTLDLDPDLDLERALDLDLDRSAPPSAQPARYVAQGSSWKRRELTYHFESYTPDLPQDEARAAVVAALQRWAAASTLTFSEGGPGSDLRIGWGEGKHGDTRAFDGAGSVLGHAYYPPPAGGATAGCVHFDEAETWSVDTPASATDLTTVALHEIGHALGLEHSRVPGTVMYSAYRGVRRELTSADIAGIQSIYGARVIAAPSSAVSPASSRRFPAGEREVLRQGA